MNDLRVSTESGEYMIVQAKLGSAEAEIALNAFVGNYSNRMLIADQNVNFNSAMELCNRIGKPARLLQLEAGEATKNFSTVEKICRAAVRYNCDRKSLFLALGGGVIGDMTGFAAAIYMRGIDFVQIPTTLLAMVDASVGGKTAVDLPEGKNLIGAFHQPLLVLIDVDFLKTLPATEIQNGVAEAIKTGVLFDERLFQMLANGSKEWPEIIHLCCKHKAAIVEADEKESGCRALLNYGHTFGHAVEKLSNFTIGHGKAVAIGMTLAAKLAVALNLCSRETLEKQSRCLEQWQLPTRLPGGMNPEAVLAEMFHDKKTVANRLALILPEKIGQCRICRDIPSETILPVLQHD